MEVQFSWNNSASWSKVTTGSDGLGRYGYPYLSWGSWTNKFQTVTSTGTQFKMRLYWHADSSVDYWDGPGIDTITVDPL